ncbi:MAG: nitroreductase family protein [Armatimonadetes bacterium]|nr:nitroreductase family protein [Armatimonadota bacterium]
MNETLRQITSHRSIRKYKTDPVSDDVQSRICRAALRASSSGNMQTLSIIVSRDPERKKQLWELHFRQDMILQAPLLLTFCADWNRMNHWCRMSDADPGFDNFLCFMVAVGDAFIAAQNAALAAESFGLGICFMGTTLRSAKELARFFSCPEGVVPVTTLVAGYPDEDPPLRDRLPASGIVHQERYRDYDDTEIRAVYETRERDGWNRYMSANHLAEKVKALGAQNLAQIYTKVKYPKEYNEMFSKDLLDVISEKGFMPSGPS